jgi:hypothetical protein
MTDSQYLVKGISEHNCDWNKNGFKNSKKQPVVIGVAFDNLNSLMMAFEEKNIRVWFWYVKKEFIQEADALAKNALDHKPKPALYITNPLTGEITVGRDWVASISRLLQNLRYLTLLSPWPLSYVRPRYSSSTYEGQ